VHLEITFGRHLNLHVNELYPFDSLRGMDGLTPLIICVKLGFVGMTSILARHGANIQQKAACGFSALHLATRNCCTLHPRLLDINRSDYWSHKSKTVYVDLELDLEILRVLQNELSERNEPIELDLDVKQSEALMERDEVQEDSNKSG
jgi:ankyrin repeat protein